VTFAFRSDVRNNRRACFSARSVQRGYLEVNSDAKLVRVQKNIGGRPVKILRVIGRLCVCSSAVIFEVI
jgi:hypothetical protein